MGDLWSLTDFLSGGQTLSDAQSNYADQATRYADQLNRRLFNGEISQSYYDSAIQGIYNNWPDANPDAQVWDAFTTAVQSNWTDYVASAFSSLESLPNAVGAVATSIGETFGNVAGGIAGGVSGAFFKSIFKPTTIVVVLVVGVIIWWLFRQPIVRNAKVIAAV